MINGFIDRKKSTINETDEMQVNLQVSDPVVKSGVVIHHKNVSSHHLKPIHITLKIVRLILLIQIYLCCNNIFSKLRQELLFVFSILTTLKKNNNSMLTGDYNTVKMQADISGSKRKYISTVCGVSGHNARNKAKCIKHQ